MTLSLLRTNKKIGLIQNRQGNILDILKSETHDIHERLHIHPMTEALHSKSITKPVYTNILKAFYGFYTPLENALEPYGHISRKKLLQKDLQALNCATNETLMLRETPHYESREEKWGAWYVVEGSSLGSTFIHKHIKNHLGYSVDHGAQFFYCYGRRTAAHWKQFCETLQKQSFNPKEQAEVVTGALKTFSSLEQWLWEFYHAGESA